MKSKRRTLHLASTHHCTNKWPSSCTWALKSEEMHGVSAFMFGVSYHLSLTTKGAICSLCFSWGISCSQSSLLRIDLQLGPRLYNPIRSGRFLEIQTTGLEGRRRILDKELQAAFQSTRWCPGLSKSGGWGSKISWLNVIESRENSFWNEWLSRDCISLLF